MSPTEHCVLCEAERPVRTHTVAPHAEPRPYLRCDSCGLVFEAPRLRTARFDFGKDVEDLTEADAAAFEEEFVESLSIAGEGGLYSDYQYEDPDEMPGGLFDQVDGPLAGAFARDESFRLLEVGCATGFLMRQVLARYPNSEAVGVEPSPVSCREAAAAGLDVRNGTTSSVPLPAGSFDAAVCIGSLMIHENPVQTLRDMAAALRPGGLLVLDVKNVRCTARLLGRIAGRVPAASRVPVLRKLAAQSFEAMRFAFDSRTITAALDRAGCDVVCLTTKPPRQLTFANRSADTRGLTGAAWRVLDRVDRLRGQQAWIDVVARKRPAAAAAAGRAA